MFLILRRMWRIWIWTVFFFVFLFYFFQPLEAIDIANSVVYVLSAPPHVQVCCLPSLCAHSGLCCLDLLRLPSNSASCCCAQVLLAQWDNLINFSLSDWRHPHATCGAGVLMLPLWKARLCFFLQSYFSNCRNKSQIFNKENKELSSTFWFFFYSLKGVFCCCFAPLSTLLLNIHPHSKS